MPTKIAHSGKEAWTANEMVYTAAQNTLAAWKVWVSTNATTTEANEAEAFGERVWIKWQGTVKAWGSASVLPRRTEREELIARNRQRSREVRQRNAARRARKLLLEHLTPEQRVELEEGACFHVETANGRRRYRIERGHVGNVHVVRCDAPPPAKADRVRVGSRLCAHAYNPDGPIPDEDHMLAQKLLLESEGGEVEFLQMANVM